MIKAGQPGLAETIRLPLKLYYSYWPWFFDTWRCLSQNRKSSAPFFSAMTHYALIFLTPACSLCLLASCSRPDTIPIQKASVPNRTIPSPGNPVMQPKPRSPHQDTYLSRKVNKSVSTSKLWPSAPLSPFVFDLFTCISPRLHQHVTIYIRPVENPVSSSFQLFYTPPKESIYRLRISAHLFR